jgi:tetraacyldisaccharide 4'-kinase
MFFNLFLKSFRILLLPFSLVYWLGIGIRNFLFDKKIFRSTSFGLPLIGIGNLTIGGTGKSPMVEYLVMQFKNRYKVATLSRGYMRKTKGYTLANEHTTALEIGDEPMQFHLKFPDIPVAVGEERIVAIGQLLHDRPETEVIILDDVFQHRSIKPGLNILLTEQDNLFTRDFYLPTGDLRDLKKSYKRAQVLVVTKCDPLLETEERNKIIKELKPLKDQQVFFTAIQYGSIYHILSKETVVLDESMEVMLVTGIANPGPLEKLVEKHSQSYSLMQYADHHIFTIDDLREIRKRFNEMDSPGRIILTTEKDAVRLIKFNQEMAGLPLYVIPIRHHFLFGEEGVFLDRVNDFIQNFKKH